MPACGYKADIGGRTFEVALLTHRGHHENQGERRSRGSDRADVSAKSARVGADRQYASNSFKVDIDKEGSFTVIREVDHLQYSSSFSKLGRALRSIAALVYQALVDDHTISSVERRDQYVPLSLSSGTLLSYGAEKIIRHIDGLMLEAF
jgi:hypothetical protein